MKDFLAGKFFDSRVSSEKVGKKEKYLGHFLEPVSVILMNSILSNYLNVYYMDVLAISGIWGGVFIGAFPVLAKMLDVLAFIYMGVWWTVPDPGRGRRVHGSSCQRRFLWSV